MRHTVVVSDIHLWDGVQDSEELWMRYRQRRFHPDRAIAAMLEDVLGRIGHGQLELVFNGDVFDFDVAPVVDGTIASGAVDLSESVAASRLAAILDDHGVFLSAVGRVLAEGHRVVFVAGNHDAQLNYPRVRALLVERLVAAALRNDPSTHRERDADRLRERIAFRSWFHRTDDGIHIEHGNQYDRYCSFRYPGQPFVRDGASIEPTVGSLVVHHVIGRLGYFNPNLDETFLLSPVGYLRHFVRYYLWSRRSLVGTWALGTLRVAWSMLRSSEPRDAVLWRRALDACAEETRVDRRALEAHTKLFRPASVREFLRTLHLDKAAMFGIGLAVGVLAWLRPKYAAALAACTVGSLAAFLLAVPNPELADIYQHLRRCQRDIVKLHGVRAIVFGHTHEAYGEWAGEVFFGNCGSWSPRFRDVECTVPYESGMPLVWLRASDDGRIEGGLYRFRIGSIVDAAAQHVEPEATWADAGARCSVA